MVRKPYPAARRCYSVLRFCRLLASLSNSFQAQRRTGHFADMHAQLGAMRLRPIFYCSRCFRAACVYVSHDSIHQMTESDHLPPHGQSDLSWDALPGSGPSPAHFLKKDAKNACHLIDVMQFL
jgi:hypothetical protein